MKWLPRVIADGQIDVRELTEVVMRTQSSERRRGYYLAAAVGTASFIVGVGLMFALGNVGFSLEGKDLLALSAVALPVLAKAMWGREQSADIETLPVEAPAPAVLPARARPEPSE